MQKSRRVKTESSFGICFEKFRTTRETFTQKCSFKNSNKIEVNFFFFHRLYFFFLSFLMHFKWFYVSFAFSILRMTGKKKQSKVLLSTFVVAGHTWCISSSRARNFASSVCCRHRQTTFTSSTSFGHLSQPSPKYDSKPWHIKETYFKPWPIAVFSNGHQNMIKIGMN